MLFGINSSKKSCSLTLIPDQVQSIFTKKPRMYLIQELLLLSQLLLGLFLEVNKFFVFLPCSLSLFLNKSILVPILVFTHFLSFFFCWTFIATIPMAKVNGEFMKIFFRNPLKFRVTSEFPIGADVYLCTYNAMSFQYLKYTFYGMHVFIVNLTPIVIVTLFLGYGLPEAQKPNPLVRFLFCK